MHPFFSRLRRATAAALLVAGAALACAQTPGAADPAAATIYDSANPGQAQLQSADDGLRGLPRDKHGAVDWVQALRSGAITPRADLAGAGRQQLLATDVIMKNTKEMPYVRFPHQAHTEWLACANCHDKPFVPNAGANPMNMEAIFRGQYCGTCHGRVSFSVLLACERCHSIPQKGAKPWW